MQCFTCFSGFTGKLPLGSRCFSISDVGHNCSNNDQSDPNRPHSYNPLAAVLAVARGHHHHCDWNEEEGHSPMGRRMSPEFSEAWED